MFTNISFNWDVIYILSVVLLCLSINYTAVALLWSKWGPESFKRHRAYLTKMYNTLFILAPFVAVTFTIFNSYVADGSQEATYSEQRKFEDINVAPPIPVGIDIRARMRELRLLKETNDRIKKSKNNQSATMRKR